MQIVILWKEMCKYEHPFISFDGICCQVIVVSAHLDIWLETMESVSAKKSATAPTLSVRWVSCAIYVICKYIYESQQHLNG